MSNPINSINGNVSTNRKKFYKNLVLVLFLLISSFLTGQTTIPGMLGPDGLTHTYTLKDHPRGWAADGSTGTLTGYLSSTTGHGRPQAGNYTYTSLTGRWTSSSCSTKTGYLNAAVMNKSDLSDYPYRCAIWAALLWVANGSNPSDTTYLPVAKWSITHAEEFLGGTFGCGSFGGKYCMDIDVTGSISDYVRISVPALTQTYSIIRGQLTPTERQLFADKMLNSNSTSHNGTGGSSTNLTADCVNQGFQAGTGTITISGTSITFSSAVLDSSWVGAALFDSTSGRVSYGRIASVTNSTTGVLSTSETSRSGVNYYYSKVWKQDAGSGIGHCGLVWELNHAPDNFPTIYPGQEANWPTNYPPAGANDSGFGATFPNPTDHYLTSIPTNNKTYTVLPAMFNIAIALADDDVRARNLLRDIWNWYYTYTLPSELSYLTPFNFADAAYTSGRVAVYGTELGISICNSFSSPEPCNAVKTGNFRKRWADYFLYMHRHSDAGAGVTDTIEQWGGNNGVDNFWQHTPMCAVSLLYPSETDTLYMNYLQENVMAAYTPSSVWPQKDYVYCDPARATTALTNAPLQFLFQDNDYAACIANTAWNNSGKCVDKSAIGYFVSRTGFGTSDTIMVASGGYRGPAEDHNSLTDYGHYQITKNDESLLWYDKGVNDYATASARSLNTIEIGGDNWGPYSPNDSTTPRGWARFTRWAGENPHGDLNNKYTYARIDMLPAGTSGTYKAAAGATRVNRDIIDFKSGTQYIVEYSDVLSSANLKKAYYQYALTAQYQYTDATITPASRTARVIHGTAARLNSAFFSADGVANHIALLVDNANGSYMTQPSAGGPGERTARLYISPSTDGTTANSAATTLESIAVHQPCANSTCTMPTIVQPACSGSGASCSVVVIQDATTPKVAMFVRQAGTLSGASFTTSHLGTAQYIIAGMPAGTYTVTLNGTAISGSPFSVSSGDGTIYFESTNGAFVVGSGPCTNSPTVTLTSPVTGTYTSIPISVSASASSNCGLNTISSLVVDDGLGHNICTSATGSCSSLWNAANGTYTVTATASDSGGNIGTASRSGVVVNTVVLPAGSVGRGKHICNGKCVMK